MAYFTPFVDETGMHIPSYNDIRDELIAQMKQIFGEEIYVDPDSQDYQQISIQARKIFDVYNLGLLVYNNRTPITAIGVGLDNDVVYANITRNPATNSLVQLTITGDAGTVINNGQASDGTNVWNLPESVTIPDNGNITVEAVADVAGNIGALPNSITTIVTPTYGWTSVTNNYAARAGVNVETDASLRGRFAMATRKTARTVFEGIWASIQDLSGVTRVIGYENDTSAASTGTEPPNTPAGLPAHSITFVVEGGDDVPIAEAIYNNKAPGVYPNGTTLVNITSLSGNTAAIRFYRPSYNDVYIRVTIKKLATYNEQYATDIKNLVSEYVLGLPIAETVYRSVVWSVATQAMTSIKSPSFSVLNVEFSEDGNTWNEADVTQLFYQAANTTPDMVTVVSS